MSPKEMVWLVLSSTRRNSYELSHESVLDCVQKLTTTVVPEDPIRQSVQVPAWRSEAAMNLRLILHLAHKIGDIAFNQWTEYRRNETKSSC